MVSQTSNVDSVGVPVDQAGDRLEDFAEISDYTSSHLAVSGVVMQELFSGVNNLDSNAILHLEADPLEEDRLESGFDNFRARNKEQKLKVSYLDGGIPIVVSEGDDSDNEALLNAKRLNEVNKNPAVKAAFAINKMERDELIASRSKLNGLNSFILRKGFKFEEVMEDIRRNEGYSGSYSGRTFDRDDLGLPILNFASATSAGGPLKSILKPIRGSVLPPATVPVVTGVKDKKDEGISGVKNDKGKEKMENMAGTKSWADVLQSPKDQVNLKTHFDFSPPPAGLNMVDPPDEILQVGIDKMRTCLTGHFSRGTVSFSFMNSEAFKAWGKKGLVKVSQKDDRTFVFRFNSVAEKDNILTRGTWYFARKPMVVMDCFPDGKVAAKITKMPIWVKLSNIPDSYWTRDLLGLLVSVIGKPLFSDNLTAQLEILPFARFCVEYKVGSPLPDIIEAKVKDPFSGVKILQKVHVHYQSKPLVCSSCNSLGHLVTFCPFTRKGPSTDTTTVTKAVSPENLIATTEVPSATILSSGNIESTVLVPTSPKVISVPERVGVNEEGWQTIAKSRVDKRLLSPGSSDASPSPISNFKSLKRVDEIDLKLDQGPSAPMKKLSKSALKKLKKNKNLEISGSVSPGLN